MLHGRFHAYVHWESYSLSLSKIAEIPSFHVCKSTELRYDMRSISIIAKPRHGTLKSLKVIETSKKTIHYRQNGQS